MASASKTPSLNLPQWVEPEKPELTDFNAAFATLDEGTGSGITVVDTYPTEEDGEDGDVYAVKGGTGVWTPAITINDSSTGITYPDGRYGFYYIAGNVLFWVCEISFNNGSSLNGSIKITGFPVKTSASRPYPAVNVSQFDRINAPVDSLGLFILMVGETDVGQMRFCIDNSSWTDFSTSHMKSSSMFFRAQGFYVID